jgi:hypothetical protein
MFHFNNQTDHDQGEETEGLKREG